MLKSPLPIEIRKARVAAGLSQTAAARLVNRSLRTWQYWETGEVPMPPELWEIWNWKAARMARIKVAAGDVEKLTLAALRRRDWQQ